MILSISGLKKSFSDRMLFQNFEVNFSLNSINVLMGFSGSGKTTLLKLIANLENRDSGVISPQLSPIGFVFQKDNLFPWLTIEENLKICSKNFSEILNLVNKFHLDNLIKKYPYELSGGQRQKINILRSFINFPQLILLDEPLAHIDSLAREEFIAFIKKLNNEIKTTIIYVTHDIDEACLIGEKIYYLCSREKKITQVISNSLNTHSTYLNLKSDPQYLELNKLISLGLKDSINEV